MSFQFLRSTHAEPAIDITAIGLQLQVRLPGTASECALEVIFTALGEVMRGGVPPPSVLDEFGTQWGVEFLGPPLTHLP